MIVKKIKENKDGTVTIDVDIDGRENKLLIQYALQRMMMEWFEREKKYTDGMKERK